MYILFIYCLDVGLYMYRLILFSVKSYLVFFNVFKSLTLKDLKTIIIDTSLPENGRIFKYSEGPK